ncbi:uncharacterized protein LOC143145039 isoform X2 [Ptiloglossa arizonensis]|uniref:uncharacterized protein LOC143145039 isoform X2 n=1 Tax=Ptiloglossa arizonensis TaxID=3350558 RepID=UPI003FA0A44F
MQWRRQRRVTHVIGSSNHVLLLVRYQDAPPGEKDEEEGLRNGYVNDQENDTSTHNFDRNGQSGYKSRRAGNSGGSGGFTGGGTRSHKDESSGSPSQPKIIFNEDEYTRITTPRQDMLFKKGYLSHKKPWASNASTSATPSTTESQSASHSTADGSETTEDQQLLDRDYNIGKYPPMMKSGTQLGYGSFYDHASGYYYEYPMMLVGPAPVPAQVGPGILAAIPCEPVPLRAIEWINPAFVPKIAEQQYCMMAYQTCQSTEDATLLNEQDSTLLPVENSNGACNESCTESASCSESVAGETEEQPVEADTAIDDQIDEHQTEEPIEDQTEEQYMDEQCVEEQLLENGLNGGPYLEPVLVQQPVHLSHMIPVSQPYMYPGHYMFGPPFVNLNGVTIQGGPMIRTTDVAAMSAGCAKRRRKRKRRKQRRLAVGNTEDEEEGEYSSECDTGLPSSRLSWTACSTSTTTTLTNRPLNPECQEFQLQPVKLDASVSVAPTSANSSTSEDGSAMNQSSALSSDGTSVDKDRETCNGVVSNDQMNQEDERLTDSNPDQIAASSPSETNELTLLDATNSEKETNGLTNCCLTGEEDNALQANEVPDIESSPSTDINNTTSDLSGVNESCERSREVMNGVEETLVNGNVNSVSNNEEAPPMTSKLSSSPYNDERTRSSVISITTESVAIRDENHESLSNIKSSKRKYSAKGTKFVREPTPGPDLDCTAESENDKIVNDLNQSLNGRTSHPRLIHLSNDSSSKTESTFDSCCEKNEEVTSNFTSENTCNHYDKDDPNETFNEDSGFESQTRLSDYPITEAVTEWLRRVNSPDVFVTSAVSNSETEDEDEVDDEPPKNLQGNPMPALSANSGADNVALSRATSCGEFARISNVKDQEGNESGLRKKRDTKKRSGERKRVRHVDGKLENEAVSSSSDSSDQQEVSVNGARKKNTAKLQDVGDVCEFTEKDSVVGMRVASSSRMMDSKRVNVRRTKRQGRFGRDSANNIDTKIQRIEDVDDENDEGIDKDAMKVKTFEKGEIVVSEDGKLLTTSNYEPISRNNASTIDEATGKDEESKEAKIEKNKSRSSDEDGNDSRINSLGSIEEPDVLECWEAETIEPVITPKRMVQCRGVSCEGEAVEMDNIEAEEVNMDYVQKYYRLARQSVTSIEEEISSKVNVDMSALKSVPNNSDQTVRTSTKKDLVEDDIPINEAFEVYESCYTGQTPFLDIDTKVFKSRTLYGQESEGPIPCKVVCCNIQ